MKINRSASQWSGLVALTGLLAIVLTGCSGSDGSDGAPGPAGPPGTSYVVTPTGATALNTTITGASVNSAPVVNFSVTNESGAPVVGLVDGNLRINIAKLVPGTNGAPSNWQNYINRTPDLKSVYGSQERTGTDSFTKAPYPWGKLVDHRDGTYTYTFCTDITNTTGTQDYTQCSTAPQPNKCPAPCTDADGNALNISYQPTLTHRVAIQLTALSGTTLPKSNATYDFVPAGGAVATMREIVKLGNCNECHSQLSAHGTRIDTKLCVTCHNPGSWIAGTPNTTVDFKVMIHKIHRGEGLPSVVGPDGILKDDPTTTLVNEAADNGTYKIGNADFSDVVFPQDIRNCTKCHTNTDTNTARNTPQGNNWQTQLSIQACGSCHDDIDFSQGPPVPNSHPGGDVSQVTDSGICYACHQDATGTGGIGSVAKSHELPSLLKAEAAKYVLKIVSVTPTTPSSMPVITFSITNAATPAVPYDIATTPAITGGSMSLILGWNTTDINNSGRSNAQPISISLLSSGALVAGVTKNSDGTYSITSTTAIPADATGSGRAGFYARMSVDVDGDGTKETIQAKSVVKDFIITGSSVVARRTVVDIAKCNQCHERLSLHGGARTDEPQLCVMCHNPNATDTARRPVGAPTGTVDNKKEESIDFKRMVHGIHAAEMRVSGLVVYGFPSPPATVNPVDFSDVRFPGILTNCTACHTTSSYQLSGVWESPTQSGILGSTIDHGASLTDPADDLNISPTAAACTGCHDDPAEQTHKILWGLANFSGTEAAINTTPELCSLCHGPGGIEDVKVRHGL